MSGVLLFLYRHPSLMRAIHRVVHRGRKDVACRLCRVVWADFLRWPGARERLHFRSFDVCGICMTEWPCEEARQ